jgi:hypothetical protein
MGMDNWTDSFKRGEHCIHVYNDEQEMQKAVLDLAHWMTKDEKMLYFSDVGSSGRLVKKPSAGREPLRQIMAEGRIQTGPSFETYCPGGKFRGDAMLDVWRGACQAASDNGFKSIVAVGDVSWLAGRRRMFPQFMNYEMSLNLNPFPISLTILCQYDRCLFTEEEIGQVSGIHQTVLSRGVLMRNYWMIAKTRAGGMLSGQMATVRIEH